VAVLVAASLDVDPAQGAKRPSSTSPASVTAGDARKLVEAARSQVGVTTGYDPSYVALKYPGGDVPIQTGVCSDVVVRALRALGIDMQQRVHADMVKNFSVYPKKWAMKRTDANIDHRRVRNLETYFRRRGYEVPVSTDPRAYLPGDIVSLQIPLDHIGIVSDRIVDGRPLLIHNVGRGAQEEDVLFAWKIVGHYRLFS
jgi:uncharacterized protein